MYSKLFIRVQTCSDKFKHIQTRSNIFRQVQTFSDLLKWIQIDSKMFKQVKTDSIVLQTDPNRFKNLSHRKTIHYRKSLNENFEKTEKEAQI